MRRTSVIDASVEETGLGARGAGPAIDPRRRSARLMRALRNILDTAAKWRERARQRRELASLDDSLFKDIGVRRADASREWRKPFWRA